MSSAETDRADRRQREKLTDQALDDDRQGRDRLRRLADAEVPPSHGQKSKRLPGTSGGSR
jgi:hypothetical protein